MSHFWYDKSVSTQTLVKKSVTIRPDLDAEVSARTTSRGYSSYVNTALENQIARDKLKEYLDAAEAEHGPVPEDMINAVQRDKVLAERRRQELLSDVIR